MLGMTRVTYEKSQHFHGLVYRKPRLILQQLISTEAEIASVDKKREDCFYIPQDFSTSIVDENIERFELTEEEREDMKESFLELPML